MLAAIVAAGGIGDLAVWAVLLLALFAIVLSI